jgi:tRNA C32,U32 (ribose-2'-O)-methylase TrmJ
MTPEERFERIERSLEFVVASQAETAARQAEHWKVIERHSEQIERNSAQIEAMSGRVEQLADLTLRIGRIVEAQGEDFNRRLKAMLEAQAQTDQRLNALIHIVERYFTDGER